MRKTLAQGLATLALTFAAQNASSAIDTSAADALFAKRGDGTTAIQNARDAYTNLIGQAQSATELVPLVEKLSRLDYYEASLLNQQSGTESQQKTVYQRCLDTLDKIAPTTAAGDTPQYYYWKATCLGGWANANGIVSSLMKSNELLGYLNKGVTVDATYEGGGFYRILGRVYEKLPAINFFGPTKDLAKSKDFLEKAIASPAYTHSAHPDLDKGMYHYVVYEYYKDTLVDSGDSDKGKQALSDAIQNYEDGYIGPDEQPEAALQVQRLRDQLKAMN